MHESSSSDKREVGEEITWQGTNFSGLIVVLGVGTGRLISLLSQQVAASQGNLIVISHQMAHLQTLKPLAQEGRLLPIYARPRQIPVLNESVDLLVVNGVLREVPENRLEAMFEEMWRVLVPGGRVRIADIIEPSEAEDNRAWAQRGHIVRKLGQALDQPVALSVNLQRAAMAMRAVGFENLSLSFLPGYKLTDEWLEETVNAIRVLSGRLVDRALRDEILNRDVKRLIALYAQGGQRAATRFVLQGIKMSDMALHTEPPFTEEEVQDEA